MKNGRKKIKQLIINTFDIKGGAARATYRLHKALQEVGIDSKMLVQYKESDDYSVIAPVSKSSKTLGKIRSRLDLLPLKKYKNFKKSPWSISWFPNSISKKIKLINPDIVHLNWICEGYIPISEITKINYPIVWTLHDMWAFTGGCHYSYECTKYQKKCGSCPQLESKRNLDISRWIWNRKYKSWRNLNLTIVTPSKWLAKCAKGSFLFKDLRVEVIPYVIDIDVFKPMGKLIAREILNLPKDKKIIVFGGISAASDRRKGFQYLQPALKELIGSSQKENIELVIFGLSTPLNPPNLSLKTNYLGIINDDIALALIYSAADVFVAPSIQDNFPNTVLESLACGTPVVAFDIGGNPDMIEHKKSGYLVKPFEIVDLAGGVNWIINDENRLNKLSQKARSKVLNEFVIDKVVTKYIKLFEELIGYK